MAGLLHSTSMNDHNQLTGTAFIERLNDCTLDPAMFTHEAHLRLGWIMVRMHGTERAGGLLCGMIARYARSPGMAEMFNRTITIASAHIIAHFLSRSRTADFATFIAQFPRLRNNFRELLDAHYSDRLHSGEDAAANFLEPDLQPF